jgi:very-short-patch-repair endonuclease
MLRQSSVSVSAHRQALLAERARSMRTLMTPSEAALWQAIRGNRLGVAFRRQVVVGGCCIADFAATEVHLVVEVDGAYHVRRAAADARRDRRLERLGWRVVRIPAEVVFGDLLAAVEVVRAAVGVAGG